MKNLIKSLITIISVGAFQMASAQCTVSATATTTNMVCGDSVTINVAGVTQGPVLFEDFNNSTLGPGWTSTQTVDYTNPCGPSLDGTPSAWMGSVATQPRVLTTIGFDLQCGATICFDLDFAGDDPCGGCTDCEDPDLFAEGVHFNYSTDGGTTWIEIAYFEANSANNLPQYQWGNYCFALPPGGWSTSTQLQWSQDLGSNNNYDHWGIDNVSIQPVDCNNNYYVVYDDGTTSVANAVGDLDSSFILTTTTNYDLTYTNGFDDTCTTTIAITVNPYNVSASATPIALNCGECTDLAMVLNNPPVNNNAATWTYLWTPNTGVADEFAQNTNACPTDDITYTGTITETTSGCVGQSSVAVTVAGGGAIADFTVFPALSGCPPLNIDFTNTGLGNSFEWFIDGVSQSTSTDFSNNFTVAGSYTVMLVAFLPGVGCINYDTMSVVVDIGNAIVPVADFAFNFQCGITSIDIWNTGTNGLDYTWDFGDGSPQVGPGSTDSLGHNFPSTGAYTVTLTVGDPICGTQSVYSEVINVVDNPITYIFNDPTCYQFSDGSITVNLLYNTGSETFLISDDQGTAVNVGGSNAANNLNSGWYYIDVDLGFGCFVQDSVELINPDELIPTVITSDVLCNGDASGSAIIDTVVGWQGNYSNIAFFWNPVTGQSGIGADSAMNIFAGNYVLTINDENGCSNTFDFTISEPPALAFTQLGSDPAYCRVFSYQIGNGVVFASAGGGTPDYDYVWTNLQDSSATSYTTWGALNPGQYWIHVTDGNGCSLDDTITVDEVFPTAAFTMTSPDFTSNYEGTAPVAVNFVNNSTFFANPNNPNADTTFYWNFNYDNPPGWIISEDVDEAFDTTYLNGGVYTVCLVAQNKNGCLDTACQEITVYDPLIFDIVNVFTPNGDGDNDEFTFVYKSFAVAEFNCIVVNRWGLTVREFVNISDTWDGTNAGGSEVSDGVYFYTYTGTADNGDTFEGQGTVTIIRGNP
jgi:gliding motility-associated-like protein